jgi:hypothetical protein
MTAIVSRFPPALPICRWCGEPGLHGTTAACLLALRAAIARLKARPTVAQPIRAPRDRATRTRSSYYLRRDRCDLPKTAITKPPIHESGRRVVSDAE